jgi:predicted DNA binding CopG/RHH family protein
MKKASTNEPKTAEEFDHYFENNDISHLLDASTKRINVDLPSPMLNRLDAKAHQLGLTRQSLLKYWIAERLKMA